MFVIVPAAIMEMPSPSCFRLFRQDTCSALDLARPRVGSNMAARMGIMAMTTSSSMSVNAPFRLGVRARLHRGAGPAVPT